LSPEIRSWEDAEGPLVHIPSLSTVARLRGGFLAAFWQQISSAVCAFWPLMASVARGSPDPVPCSVYEISICVLRKDRQCTPGSLPGVCATPQDSILFGDPTGQYPAGGRGSMASLRHFRDWADGCHVVRKSIIPYSVGSVEASIIGGYTSTQSWPDSVPYYVPFIIPPSTRHTVWISTKSRQLSVLYQSTTAGDQVHLHIWHLRLHGLSSSAMSCRTRSCCNRAFLSAIFLPDDCVNWRPTIFVYTACIAELRIYAGRR